LAPNGAYPGDLIQARDGAFYGVTKAGGSYQDAGVIFRATTNGNLSVLYVFTNGIDGASASSSLIQASNGELYGTAAYGGVSNFGTIFKITTNGVFTPFYSFTNGLDSERPFAPLLEGGDGYFYGTAGSYIGSGGSIFKMNRQGAVTILHTFASGSDGANPFAPLIAGTDGTFYGTTAYGGTTGEGTVFNITTNGLLTTLHSFSYTSDGALPWGPVVLGRDGNLYGTTYSGGAHGEGTVFKMATNGDLTLLYSFTLGSDGGKPQAGLSIGPNGKFYGTTYGYGGGLGETSQVGTIFEISPAGDLTTLYTFTNGAGGANPTALTLGLDGDFYGCAGIGGVVGWGGPIGGFPGERIQSGNSGWGTLFRLGSDGDYTTLAAFPAGPDGANPAASLIQATNGLFYGVTQRGGTNDDGVVFQMDLGGSTQTLHSFAGDNDGAAPVGPLTQGSDGNFYGTTYEGGPGKFGTIFKMTQTGALSTICAFTNGTNGGHPLGALIQAGNGNFYGTTDSGGTATGGAGTVYQLTLAGTLTTLHVFSGGTDGDGPCGLTLGPDGAFYGITAGGGTNGDGAIFKITTDGAFTPLYSLLYATTGGGSVAPLTLGSDGNFYGTCESGSSNQYGSIFKVTPTGMFSLLHSFTNGIEGSSPAGPLTQGTDGTFYGTTLYGGDNDFGTMFRITTNGQFVSLHSFEGLSDGSYCWAGLLQATNGSFYLLTEGAPPYTSGTALLFTAPPNLSVSAGSDGAFQLLWGAEIGQKYQAQYCDGFPAVWTNLGASFIATTSTAILIDAPPPNGQRFYRVTTIP
jgi:uncharacterized repeat protein (TIGR03803 family)